MPIGWLIGLVGLGVPGVVLLTHLTGGSEACALDEASVQALIDHELEEDVTTIRVADDGAHALVELWDGRVAVVWAMESHLAVRVVPAASLASVESDEDGLFVRVRDVGFPSFRFAMADAAGRELWVGLLTREGLVELPELPKVVELAVPAFVGLMLLELAVGRLTGKARYDTRDTAASLAMGTGNLVWGILFGFISFGVYLWVYEYRLMTWGLSIPAFILAYFLDDLRYYWYHRFSHVSRWWWWGHVTHHSSQHYNLSTALRQEWSNPWNLSFVMRLPLIFFLGIHPVMLVFLGGINLVYQFWVHTETIRRFPAPIEWFFNTPSHHRVHHGSNPRYLDANYAGTFIIWDRLFGTFVPELDDEPVRYGLVKNLNTYNPVRIAFHELVGIARDATQPGLTLVERLRYVFDRPGYSHDGSRQTALEIKADFVSRHPDQAGQPGLPGLRSVASGASAKRA